jgi:hypothetical protein
MKLKAVDETVSIEDREWQARAEQLTLNSLYDIRAVASRWAATIGSLTGLLSLVALVAGPRAVDQLQLGWRIVAGVLVLVAILTAGWATWSAADAAQGKILTTLSTYARIREDFREEETRARSSLSRAKTLVVVAMVALVLAVAVSWFAPSGNTQNLVIRQAGVVVSCVPLTGSLTVSLNLGGRASVTVADSCPSR